MAFIDRELDQRKREGLYRRLRELQSAQGARAVFDGREVINLSSNNYLGLTTHPRLVQAAEDANPKVRGGFRVPSAPSPAP